MTPAAPATKEPPAKSRLRRRLPILVMLAVALAGLFFLRDSLSFATLAEHQDRLAAFRDRNFLLASVVFMAAYAVIVAFSLPGATIATLAGGFLFGMFPGTAYNVIAATTGACAVFLAARAGFGAALTAGMAAKGGAVARLSEGLRQNEWPVLFLMRLIPVVPFFLANLIPAFLGVSLFRFAVSTFLGIIPGALVFTSVGAGLSEVFARGETPDLSLIFAPHILGPILGLAALAALPLVVRAVRGRGL